MGDRPAVAPGETHEKRPVDERDIRLDAGDPKAERGQKWHVSPVFPTIRHV